MNLGENIYRFRTERNMSQGALAEALEVSRQSVSKWENNSATPELDKLIKMSELFGITLDELVGKEVFSIHAPESVTPEIPVRQPMPYRLITGIILLCFGFLTFLVLSILGGLISGLILSAPLFIFAAICLICKTRVILKCCWALLIMICEYVTFATGASRRTLFVYLASDLSNFLDYPYIVYTIVSLIINVLLIALIIWTVSSYNQNYTPVSIRGKRLLILGWILFLLACLIQPPHFEYDYALIRITSILLNLCDWIKIGLFTVLLTYTLRLLPKQKGESQ